MSASFRAAQGWHPKDTQHVATSLRCNAACISPVFECRRVRRRALSTHCMSAVSSEPSQDQRAVLSDAAVPEGHRDLHGFLYGEGGAEVHSGPSSNRYEPVQGEDDGTELIPLTTYLTDRESKHLTGVYALYNNCKEVQYVGYARNFLQPIKAHLSRVGKERCAYVRAMVFANKAMATRTALAQQAENWLRECGSIPPGNGEERQLWEGTRKGGMNASEAAAHEEIQLKMRKAMGESLRDAEPGEDQDAYQRRLNLIRAVEGDDWSHVIGQQSLEAVGQPPPEPSEPQAHQPEVKSQPVTTPFARAAVHRSIGNVEAARQEMTVQGVDTALEEVRPYLIADGGNVTVVDVTDGNVFLSLEGACGTCPSSSATMKMGIERALRATFGEALKEVLQVGVVNTAMSSADVDAHLDSLRPAIASYGVNVQVVEVDKGVCKVAFSGPKPIGAGIQAAIKDRFPEIRSVVLLDP